MALHLPKPRSKAVPQKTVGLDGMKVTVAAAAAAGVAKAQETSRGLAGLTSGSNRRSYSAFRVGPLVAGGTRTRATRTETQVEPNCSTRSPVFSPAVNDRIRTDCTLQPPRPE